MGDLRDVLHSRPEVWNSLLDLPHRSEWFSGCGGGTRGLDANGACLELWNSLQGMPHESKRDSMGGGGTTGSNDTSRSHERDLDPLSACSRHSMGLACDVADVQHGHGEALKK